MQQQTEKKFTDGGRLQSLKSTTGKTWEQIRAELGISRSMLFSVLKGDKRLGRDNLAALDNMQKVQCSSGVPVSTQKRDCVCEAPEAYCATPAERIAKLEEELATARQTIYNLSVALSAVGRAPCAPPDGMTHKRGKDTT